MTKYAAIEADFATWRPVQGRKVLQLVFEVPIEKTQHVLDTLGIPQPGDSKWCAIALLDLKPAKAEGPSREAAAPPKPFSSLPLSQQAALKCADVDFQKWIGGADEETAAKRVRDFCVVNTRADITKGSDAGRQWEKLLSRYDSHRTDRQYAGSKR